MPMRLFDPVDEIDEILAALTLQERQESRQVIDDAEYSESSRTHSSPALCHRTTGVCLSATLALDSLTRSQPRLTPDWSLAATAVQGGHGGSVRSLHSASKRRRKYKVYVVFRGHHVGLVPTWPQCSQATQQFRFSLFQGYQSSTVAAAAFDYALDHGWVSTQATLATVPVPRASVPGPIAVATGPEPAPLSRRAVDDLWYIVYRGVHPGIFPTFLECALNVLGYEGAVHESVHTFAEAQAKFARAQRGGEVVVL
ncbi:hypothetical protein FB45DRAFT_1034231 [Roridomyces roridus]|uniref:Ribonuclease H1 N-terminal domain-containing protein n=1 Tax=Roridomyces roridus TaxID=1738132 RepID=A0AAD7BE41_9AGAR|nr:hypothetical protein FB45DRAFT_1034231 [Roridomyces roridus]